MLHKTLIAFVTTVALGCVPATTSAFARGGAGHGGGFGGGMGGGHFGGGFGGFSGGQFGNMGAGHLGGFGPSHVGGTFAGGHVVGRFGHDRFRRFGYGYYGCDYSYGYAYYPYGGCGYDPDTIF